MKKITTKDIIKILPFDEQFKQELLSGFDNLDPDKKFNLEQKLWDTYDAFYELQLKKNMQLALMRARENQEKLDKDFYKRIREQTDKEMQSETVQSVEQVDLSTARKAMELIVKEIQASKKTTK